MHTGSDTEIRLDTFLSVYSYGTEYWNSQRYGHTIHTIRSQDSMAMILRKWLRIGISKSRWKLDHFIGLMIRYLRSMKKNNEFVFRSHGRKKQKVPSV